MSLSLNGHIALVTGSSAGLGKAIALRLAGSGAKIAINYHNRVSQAESTLAELQDLGCTAILVRGDVTQAEDVAQIYDAIASQLGPVDILVLNATGKQAQIPFEEYTWQDFQTMLDFFVKSSSLSTNSVRIVRKFSAKKYRICDLLWLGRYDQLSILAVMFVFGESITLVLTSQLRVDKSGLPAAWLQNLLPLASQ